MLNMPLLFCFVVIIAVTGWAVSQDMPPTAVLSIAQGEPQVFVREKVTLSCSIPGNLSDLWRYLWFKDEALIREYSSVEDTYTLTPVLPTQSGHYTCQGEMTTWNGSLFTAPSQPLRIDVHGGWAILQSPPLPLFIGDGVTLTCRVRGDPIMTEVVFYKDGAELQRQKHPKLHLYHLEQQDQGAYWCKATWRHMSTWMSTQSLAVQLPVIEKLTVPVMEVLNGGHVLLDKPLVLRCQVQLNLQQPGLQLRYYFLKNGRRLGVATSRDRLTISRATQQDSGHYQCKVSVEGMDLSKLSDELLVEVNAVPELP